MDNQLPYRITLEWDDDDFYQDTMHGISRLPTPDVIAEKTENALQATMLCIRDMGERLNMTLQATDAQLAQAEIEFGIRLGAENGVLTKSNEAAHFIIKLVWKRNPD
ncbi:MAG: CU044_2847 family protein [Anaerolineales bacterium]